jgi:predicted RNA-binding Zn ribbon-like protein
MKRMNLREVPDEVYETLSGAAAARSQSLNAFVVDVLTEMASVITLADYVHSYQPPSGTGISLEDVVAAVRAGREEL